MSGAMIAGGLGVASSVAGAAGGGKGDEGAAASGATIYDPFAQAREGYIKQLGRFMRDPSRIYETPAYKARFAAGQRAVESSAAARGLLDSGALGIELAQYGQQTAAEEYQAEFARLAQLAQVSPLIAGGGPQQQQQTGWGDVAGAVSQFPWGQIFGKSSPTQATYGQNLIGGSAFL